MVLQEPTSNELKKAGKKKPDTNSNLWRNTKKTDEVVGKLVEIFKIDWTITEACSYANIDRSTYYDWLDKDEEFSNKMGDAKEYAFIEARRTINKAIKEGDWRLALDIMRRRDGRYKDKAESEVTGELSIWSILAEIQWKKDKNS